MNQEQIQEKESIKIVNLRKTIIIKDENGKVILNLTKTDSISIEGNLNENGVLFSETNPATTSSTNYNYSYDKNGNVIQDDTGNVVERNNYGPFGSVFEGGNSRYTYTGKETDSTGLSYYGARYYSADILRRFTQADTLIPDVYNPQALNRYSYVLNNPYKYVDNEGNFGQLAPLLIAGAYYFTTYAAVPAAEALTADAAITALFISEGYQEGGIKGAVATVGALGVGGIIAKPITILVGKGASSLGGNIQALANKQAISYSEQIAFQTEVSEAYPIAVSGGKHYGTYFNYLSRSNKQIERAIRGYGKQISIHEDKLANPSKYIPDWDKLSVTEQRGLISKWQNDIRRNTEIRNVLSGTLKEKQNILGTGGKK